MRKSEIFIPREWISQFKQLILFFVFCILTVFLSHQYSWTVITGKLFTAFGYRVDLSIPIIFLMLPFALLSKMILRIYDVRYTVDPRGVQAQIGIVSMRQRIIRVRYEDIRTIEVSQTVMERILNIGRVDISTAASSDVEVYFSGIKAPVEFQNWLQAESDGRQKNVVIRNSNVAIDGNKGGE